MRPKVELQPKSVKVNKFNLMMKYKILEEILKINKTRTLCHRRTIISKTID